MSSEKEKKEGEATEEQSEGKDVQDQMCPMWPSPFFRRRDLGLGGSANMREVWREPLGAETMSDLAAPFGDADAVRNRVGLELGFFCEYMGRFPDLVREEILAEGLWAQYHLDAERFDKVICSGRRDGVAVPSDACENRMINRHAQELRIRLKHLAHELRVGDDQLAVSARVVTRYLMSTRNYLVEETMVAMVQRMRDMLESEHV